MLANAIWTTLASCIGVATTALVCAAVLGGLAGRGGGLASGLLRRLVELSGALPIFVAVPLLSRVWPPIVSTIVVLGLAHGLRLACLCRNETSYVYTQPFVRTARALGIGTRRTVLLHVVPRTFAPLAVGVAMTLPLVIGVEAALSVFQLSSIQSVGAYVVSGAGGVGLPAVALVLGLMLGLYALGERLIEHRLYR